MIEVRNAKIGYVNPLIQIPQLNLRKGELYGLVGANGKGKSTFMKSVIGEIDLLEGEILMDGLPIQPTLDQRRSKLFSFVSSRFAGIPHLRVLEYVLLGRTPYLGRFGQVTEKDRDASILALEAVDILHLQNKFTEEISDGERQMVAIARAMAQDTPYVFLDEPTAFLDYKNKRKIMELLQQYVRSEEKSVLVTSHDLEILLQSVDTIFCIPESSTTMRTILKKDFELESIIQQTFH
ncbi:MAG: ABC transporter ATP-binding protein [Bacteroidetes bacterium]|nr:ABC transporter ATP-binding protein [Bacteroidota bacterium]